MGSRYRRMRGTPSPPITLPSPSNTSPTTRRASTPASFHGGAGKSRQRQPCSCRVRENGGIENGGIENGGIENGGIENVGIENEGIENEGIKNEGIKNEGIENEGIEKRV